MTTWTVMADVTGDTSESRCAHVDLDTGVAPNVTGACEDCLREGSTWVHLRACLTCGHVGCCDSSPRKHASAHYAATTHPLARSVEPGEHWAWCYSDELILVPGDAGAAGDAGSTG